MELAGEILAKSPKLRKRVKAAASLTRSQEKFIEAATVIRMNPDDAEAAFMAAATGAMHLASQKPGQGAPVGVTQRKSDAYDSAGP